MTKFANKTAHIKYKKLTSLCYCVSVIFEVDKIKVKFKGPWTPKLTYKFYPFS